MTKICSKCRRDLGESDYHTLRSGVIPSTCKQCNTTAAKAVGRAARMTGARQQYERDYARRIRLEVISHYSGGTMRCLCCGEPEERFLTIDHENNDGSAHRAKL